jgi:hypothetical protein
MLNILRNTQRMREIRTPGITRFAVSNWRRKNSVTVHSLFLESNKWNWCHVYSRHSKRSTTSFYRKYFSFYKTKWLCHWFLLLKYTVQDIHLLKWSMWIAQ